MPTTSERGAAETERRPAPRKSAVSTGSPFGNAAAAVRARLAAAALTLTLTVSISAILLIAWLWALALWYPASRPPAADPNHGCGPMVACVDT